MIWKGRSQLCMISTIELLYIFLLQQMCGKYLLVVFILFTLGMAISNPGILITIPFPLQPPTLALKLPQAINDTVISGLELTAIEIRSVDYKWKLSSSQADVNISLAHITFDWSYKTDKGKGFFTEQDLRLIFLWTFNMTNQNRFQIVVPSTKIHPGKMKVSLGGGVKQTIVVQITNLILNHASILFRGIIAKKLSDAITDASKILGNDINLYHDKQTNKNFKVNTTLVTNPIISNQVLIIQVNGAPYVEGQKSDYLNPHQALVKNNGSKIQMQIHKQFVTKFIELYFKLKREISVSINMIDVTSVVDIDSLGLSPVFPAMNLFTQIRDVIFDVKVPEINFEFIGNSLAFTGKGQVVISTQAKNTHNKILYMDPVNVSASVQIIPVFGSVLSSGRVQHVKILNFTPSQSDIGKEYIIPEALSKYFSVLMQWVTDAVNLALQRKVTCVSYDNIMVNFNSFVTNELVCHLDITLVQKS